MQKTVLITGASSGIGRATAKLFAKRDWNVVVALRHPAAEAEFATAEQILVTRLDVTERDSIQATLEAAIRKFTKIDVVVNNAGYGLLGAFEAATEDQILEEFQTNVFGLFNVTQACLPHFRARRQGLFINVSSMLGRFTLPFFSLYAATKWSVEGFSEALQQELQPFNIRVKLIEPGTIRSDFYARSLHLTQRAGLLDYDRHFAQVLANIQARGAQGTPAAAVAQTIYAAAEDRSDKMRYRPDSTAKLLLTLHAILPTRLFHRVIKQSIG